MTTAATARIAATTTATPLEMRQQQRQRRLLASSSQETVECNQCQLGAQLRLVVVAAAVVVAT